MKSISFWAKSNPIATICIIIICHVILFITAIFLGTAASDSAVHISPWGMVAAAAVFFTAAVYYPYHTGKKSGNRYHYQKLCDFLIIFSGFIMLIIGSYQLNMKKYAATTAIAATMHTTTYPEKKPTAKEILASGKKGAALSREEKKILRVELKHQLKIYSKAQRNGNKAEKENAGLVVLAIIGAIGLGLLLSALVCSIACGGAEGAAVVIAIVGLAGIIWLTVFLIKRITHPRHPKVKEPASTPPPNTSA